MNLNLAKFKIKIGNIPNVLAERCFLSFWIMLFIALTLGGVIFYQYIFVLGKIETRLSKESLNLKKENYEKVLESWQSREKRFQELDSKDYLNPFKLGDKHVIEESTSTATSTESEATSTEEGLPEEVISPLVEKLMKARNLHEFYYIQGRNIPLLSERAVVWQEKGLGQKDLYFGTDYQNQLLLSVLKKELTQ